MTQMVSLQGQERHERMQGRVAQAPQRHIAAPGTAKRAMQSMAACWQVRVKNDGSSIACKLRTCTSSAHDPGRSSGTPRPRHQRQSHCPALDLHKYVHELRARWVMTCVCTWVPICCIYGRYMTLDCALAHSAGMGLQYMIMGCISISSDIELPNC